MADGTGRRVACGPSHTCFHSEGDVRAASRYQLAQRSVEGRGSKIAHLGRWKHGARLDVKVDNTNGILGSQCGEQGAHPRQDSIDFGAFHRAAGIDDENEVRWRDLFLVGTPAIRGSPEGDLQIMGGPWVTFLDPGDFRHAIADGQRPGRTGTRDGSWCKGLDGVETQGRATHRYAALDQGFNTSRWRRSEVIVAANEQRIVRQEGLIPDEWQRRGR